MLLLLSLKSSRSKSSIFSTKNWNSNQINKFLKFMKLSDLLLFHLHFTIFGSPEKFWYEDQTYGYKVMWEGLVFLALSLKIHSNCCLLPKMPESFVLYCNVYPTNDLIMRSDNLCLNNIFSDSSRLIFGIFLKNCLRNKCTLNNFNPNLSYARNALLWCVNFTLFAKLYKAMMVVVMPSLFKIFLT